MDLTDEDDDSVCCTAVAIATYNGNNVSMMITQESWAESVFSVCDCEKTGSIFISDFMEYLRSFDQSDSQNEDKLSQLEQMFLSATNNNPSITFETFNKVMAEWIAIVKDESSASLNVTSMLPDDSTSTLDSLNLSGDENRKLYRRRTRSNNSELDSSSLQQFSFGTLEGIGGDLSLSDIEDLNCKVQSLSYQLSCHQEEKKSLQNELCQAEETILKCQLEIEELNKNNKILVQEVTKGEQVRDEIIVTQEKFKEMYDKVYNEKQQLIQEKNVLERRIQSLDAEVCSCRESLQRCKNYVAIRKKYNKEICEQSKSFISKSMLECTDRINKLEKTTLELGEKFEVLYDRNSSFDCELKNLKESRIKSEGSDPNVEIIETSDCSKVGSKSFNLNSGVIMYHSESMTTSTPLRAEIYQACSSNVDESVFPPCFETPNDQHDANNNSISEQNDNVAKIRFNRDYESNLQLVKVCDRRVHRTNTSFWLLFCTIFKVTSFLVKFAVCGAVGLMMANLLPVAVVLVFRLFGMNVFGENVAKALYDLLSGIYIVKTDEKSYF